MLDTSFRRVETMKQASPERCDGEAHNQDDDNDGDRSETHGGLGNEKFDFVAVVSIDILESGPEVLTLVQCPVGEMPGQFDSAKSLDL